MNDGFFRASSGPAKPFFLASSGSAKPFFRASSGSAKPFFRGSSGPAKPCDAKMNTSMANELMSAATPTSLATA